VRCSSIRGPPFSPSRTYITCPLSRLQLLFCSHPVGRAYFPHSDCLMCDPRVISDTYLLTAWRCVKRSIIVHEKSTHPHRRYTPFSVAHILSYAKAVEVWLDIPYGRLIIVPEHRLYKCRLSASSVYR
jgi:hypothetical protein